MSVKVTDNTPIVRTQVNNKIPLFLRQITEQIDKTAYPITPQKHGLLRRNVTKQVLGNHAKIRWMQRYAIYQEAKQFKRYTTAGTGPHFAEKAVRQTVAVSDRIWKAIL